MHIADLWVRTLISIVSLGHCEDTRQKSVTHSLVFLKRPISGPRRRRSASAWEALQGGSYNCNCWVQWKEHEPIRQSCQLHSWTSYVTTILMASSITM